MMSFHWLAHILIHHPLVILIGVLVFSVTCLVIPFTLKSLPDFSDPQMGFETRGTILSSRLTTWRNLEKATKFSGPFAVNPKEFLERKDYTAYKRIRKNDSKRAENESSPDIFINVYNESSLKSEKNNWITLHNLINHKSPEQHKTHHLTKDGYFCGQPDHNYAHVVLKSSIDADLFMMQPLSTLCRLEYELVQAKHYKNLCMHPFKKAKKCCKPWSLPNYIAQLHNRTSCLAIVDEDIQNMKMLLQSCAQYYHNLQLAPDCHERGHCKVPVECVRDNAVYNILNFLTSTSFLPPDDAMKTDLKETMIFLPVASGTAALTYYNKLDESKLKFNGISVVAMEFGIKSILFDKCLIEDAWFMTSGGVFVFLCIWFYTRSLFITFMTVVAIVFSLGISYFMYTLVFELRFFPFMNLLATIVSIGIGADDAFIFCKAWHNSKQQKGNSIMEMVNDTFHHALVSMLITSITTAAAFLASYISSITAIRCFSVFATTAVIVNCILMMSWLPASVIIGERFQTKCTRMFHSCSSPLLMYWKCWEPFWKFQSSFFPSLWHNKDQILADIVIKFRLFWLIFLSVVAIGSAIVVLYYPRLQLPNSPEFQLFKSSHPFEKYDLIYKNHFWFERSDKIIYHHF
ncbi:hypothetical protein RI129_011708 [Pyrocoelia pectoralis]|uniref:SSD domain-containing protein n=1 Tax=Pyrocoelia pectoralis TaxID=417401 RepID=A0AAN7ZG39_9COLE